MNKYGGVTVVIEAAVGAIVSTIMTFLTGVGEAFVDFFNVTFLTAEGALTTFATWCLILMGLSFAFTVISAVLRKIG